MVVNGYIDGLHVFQWLYIVFNGYGWYTMVMVVFNGYGWYTMVMVVFNGYSLQIS